MPPSLDGSRILTEEPDLVIGHLVGHVTGDVMQRLFDVQHRFSEGKPHLFLIVHVRHVADVTSEARRVVIDAPKVKVPAIPILGCSFVGASFHVRVLGTMVFRAARLLGGANTFPVRYDDTENEARAWIDNLRRELRRPR
ncbi:hypothetical protein [Polyangium sp. 6x1]|uniref:hypothetical protein n=1 Tax=Polyangium sp. 6x1 TaxID=3042689 RepID=UPI0024829492|nr:hypothetical protein [Polyangium sp. 6x1]MDI1444142.1 hypothetical protein [Polyangium sp. 6x1]